MLHAPAPADVGRGKLSVSLLDGSDSESEMDVPLAERCRSRGGGRVPQPKHEHSNDLQHVKQTHTAQEVRRPPGSQGTELCCRPSRKLVAGLEGTATGSAEAFEGMDYASLPLDVLQMVFQHACRSNALPTAPRSESTPPLPAPYPCGRSFSLLKIHTTSAAPGLQSGVFAGHGARPWILPPRCGGSWTCPTGGANQQTPISVGTSCPGHGARSFLPNLCRCHTIFARLICLSPIEVGGRTEVMLADGYCCSAPRWRSWTSKDATA